MTPSNRDAERSADYQRTAHAIINRAITSNPGARCKCSLCLKTNAAIAAVQPKLDGREPHKWKRGDIALAPNGHYYCYLTPIDGVAVRVDSERAEDVLRIANSIENMEVRS